MYLTIRFKKYATNNPPSKPGIENEKDYNEMSPIKLLLLKPRALSIPYS